MVPWGKGSGRTRGRKRTRRPTCALSAVQGHRDCGCRQRSPGATPRLARARIPSWARDVWGRHHTAVAALGTRRPAGTVTLSQRTATLSPARKGAGCEKPRAVVKQDAPTAGPRANREGARSRGAAARRRAAGSETAGGLGKPDLGPLSAAPGPRRWPPPPGRPHLTPSPPPARTRPPEFAPGTPLDPGRSGRTWKTGMLRSVRPGSLWLLRLWTAWALLPLAAADGGAAGLPKAVVRLEPPWINVLRGDSVTLHCQGPQGPGDGPTQWSRDGTPIPTQDQPRFSLKASLNDSGDYRCQLDQTSLSDPVHLNVTSDWLLLQTPRLRLQEGDPLLLRCHNWMSRPLFKILFFQDGRAKWYSPSNASLFIPRVNASHGGKYHCSGIMGSTRRESHPVRIDIQADPPFPSIAPFSLPWPQIAFCLVMGLLFAVDTGLYFSARRDLRSSMGDLKSDKVTWSKSFEDK